MSEHLTQTQRQAVTSLLTISPGVSELGEKFAAAGFDLHLVGGTVRDVLLNRLDLAKGDLDFTTNARPEQVLALLADWAEATWTTGIEFGTVGAQHHGERYEITTYRADRYDRISRNPIVQFGDSLNDDLLRRDFTINAMALSIHDGEFTDPFGGLADLAAGVLRTPASPEMSFADDPLRMLRAARFTSQLGFSPAPDVIEALEGMSPEIERITPERVQVELSKLLTGRFPRAGLELLVHCGLADFVLPELPALQMEIDEHHQHKDVYVHSLTVLDQAIALEGDAGPDLTLRMAAILHDIGKPPTRRHEAGGGVSFHHHEVVGAKMARKRLRALRYSKEFIEDVAGLIYLHLRFHGYGRGEWTDSAVRRYVADAGPLLDRLHKLVRSDCTTRNRKRAAILQATYDALEQRIAILSEQEELNRIRPDLNGNEIMQLLGLTPGPMVGQAYRHLLALRIEHGPLSREQAITELHRWADEHDIPIPPAD